MNSHFLFLMHVIGTSGMVGVIWLVQLTHYPTYRYIDPTKFQDFEKFHCNSITFIVLPLMLLEAGSAAMLLVAGERSAFFLLSLVTLGIVWLSTFLNQVPIHGKLGRGFNPDLVERLVSSNWLRTVGWSLRLVLVVAVFGGI